MLKKLSIAVVLTMILVNSSHAMAKEGCGGECTSCHSLTTAEASGLMKSFGGTVLSVRHSPSRGLFELLVEKEGKKGILFLDYGKKHIINGMVFNLDKLEPVIAHKNELPPPKSVSAIDVGTIPANLAVVIGNPKGSKKLFVFTDPDCPWCQKGHAELKKLAAISPDTAIHIMLFPLPMHPAAYDKSRAIFEANNPDVLDKAFEGKAVPAPKLESSKKVIDEIIRFAKENGITVTPTLVLPNGRIREGLPDAEGMKKLLEGK